jgi:hypothetical protein
MTRLIYVKGKGQEVKESKKPILYLGKELEFIDYTETTAIKEFCRIKFKGEDKEYWEQSYKIEVKD